LPSATANTRSGTEQDRVNCSFFLKIGACRHGDRCSRKHIKPQFSQTICLPNVYTNPGHTSEGSRIGEERLQKNFDRFYEDFWIELCKYGHLMEMHVSGVGTGWIGVYLRLGSDWQRGQGGARDMGGRWQGGG
jgi:splicing factor U2AF subunit